MIELRRQYQPFNVEAANMYDNLSRFTRVVLWFGLCLWTGRLRDGYSEFLRMEIYLGQESLKRKLNRVFYHWDEI